MFKNLSNFWKGLLLWIYSILVVVGLIAAFVCPFEYAFFKVGLILLAIANGYIIWNVNNYLYTKKNDD